ncbi:zinc finger protein ZFP2-like [Danaus plexippus]|uniref:zinc finger protein ZFP2-like n=1 Tax=Danaus plexippus TaxID=13037 RepID=UPI002AB0187C|nr:zinc finger protein ZFP2-like [Danaus plexippus]
MSNMTSLGHILRSIINRTQDYCLLCQKQIEGNPINIQDEVVLKETDSNASIKIYDVLSLVLGYEISCSMSALEVLCKHCTHSAVNCYKFIVSAKASFDTITTAISNLKTCLENTPEGIEGKKSLYITLDTSNFATQHYYDNQSNINSSIALKNFQSLFVYNSNDNRQSSNKTIGKRHDGKRRDYFTVPIKTSEMLYDKNDKKNLKCKACLKLYPSLSNLRNHFIRVHAPKDYKCDICQRKFGSLALVEAHKSESHCTIVCSECGKTFHNRHTLKMHEIGHYLKLVCQDCGRVYKSQTTFKKHIDLNICSQKTRASPANAKFTCDYCNKKYTQKVSLRVHIQYEHGNYKSHECKWCKKKFWAQSRLKAHIVKHTQEKKFQCNMCGGKFVTKESLLYHTRTHTGEKPYKCEFCDSRFLSTSRRVDHMKRHHADLIFQCQMCNMKYTTQVCLEKHMKTHKNVDKTVEIPTSEGVIHVSEDEIYLDMSDEDYMNQHVG